MSGSVDVLIICALKDELDALLEVRSGLLEVWKRAPGDPECWTATLDGDAGTIRVVAARPTKMGIGTTEVADTLARELRPQCLAMCGVCAGHPDATDLGDVIIADRVIQLDDGKLKEDGFQADLKTYIASRRWRFDPQEFEGPATRFFGYASPEPGAGRWWVLERLRSGRNPKTSGSARYVDADRRTSLLESLVEAGDVRITDGLPTLTKQGRAAVDQRNSTHSEPVEVLPYHIHVGPIGSGNYVAADGGIWERIANIGGRKTLGLEMEAAAVGRLAHASELPFVVAKGVMDHGDKHKTDRFKKFAARASAEVLVAFLRRVVVPGGQRSPGPDAADGPVFEGPLPERHFKGREDELVELEQLLRANQGVCVVATGIGGVGKTTLVSQFVVERGRELFPDGVAWIDGSPERFTSELARVAKRFGWQLQTTGRDPTPEEAVRLLNETLANKRVLLVVDGFDPEQHNPAHVPRPWPGSRTIVTSRARTLDQKLGAVRLELDVWPVEICREYLRTQCRDDCPWANTASDAELDELALFVGRQPLGVRLLVSVMRNRPSTRPAEILALLRAQPLDALDMHNENRGIAATFRWGYDHLNEPRRRTLQALSACARRTRADIVAAVAELTDAREALDYLHTHGFAEHYADRHWGLHDVVRMFVLVQPGSEGFAERQLAWVQRHLEAHAEPTAFREFAEGVDEAMHAFGYWATRHVRVAVAVYRPLFKHLSVVGRYTDALRLSQAMLAAASPDSIEAANAFNDIGLRYRTLGDFPKAIDYHQHALAINEQLGRLEGQATDLGNLGLCYLMLGNIPKAIDYHQHALAINEQLGRLEGQATDLGNLGVCYQTSGDFPRAIDYHQHALAINEQLGRLEGRAAVLGNLGVCYRTLGDFPKAIDCHQHALVINEQLGRLEGQATDLGNLGVCYQTLGDFPKAIEHLQRALAINEQLGRLEGQAIQLGNLGLIAKQQGTSAEARDYLTRALSLFRQMGFPDDHPMIARVVTAIALPSEEINLNAGDLTVPGSGANLESASNAFPEHGALVDEFVELLESAIRASRHETLKDGRT